MTTKKILFWEILILSALVSVMHKISLVLFLYWTTPWADIVLHFMGGYLIAIMAIYVFFVSGWIKFPRSKSVAFVTVISTVLVIGLGWELWELFTGFTDILKHKSDTILDIIMDVLGGVMAYIIHNKIYEE